MSDGKLIFNTSIDTSGFKDGMESIKKTGSAASEAINKGMKIAGAAVLGAGAASVKMGMDFESGMSRVKALSGATGDEFEMLEKSAKDLGRTTSFSATEASEGMQALAMAGYDANEITSAMPGLLAAAAAGQTDLGQTADIVSNILGGFNMKADETDRVADVMSATFSSSNTTLESLGESMKYAGPVASAMGFEFEEVAAAVGMLGDAGISGGQAGRHLRTVMSRLTDPTSEAASAMEEYGIEVLDASGNVKPMSSILDSVSNGLEGMTDAQKAATVSQLVGTDAAASFLVLMDQGGPKLEEFTSKLRDSEGAAKDLADEMLNNLKGDLELLKSAFEGVGIEIFQSFSEPLRESIQLITEWASAIGGVLAGADNFKDSLMEIDGVAEKFGSQIEHLPDGMAGAVQVMGMMAVQMVEEIASNIPNMVAEGTKLIGSFLDTIRSQSKLMGNSAAVIMTSLIKGFLKTKGKIIEVGIEIITSFITGMSERMPEIINTIKDMMFGIMYTITDNLPEIMKSGMKIVVELINSLTKNMPRLIEIATDIIDIILTSIIDNLDSLIEAGVGLLDAVIDGLVKNMPKIIKASMLIISKLLKALVDNADKIMKAGLDIVKALVEGISKNMPKVIEAVEKILEFIMTAFNDNIGDVIEVGIMILTTVIKGIVDNLPMIIDTVLEIAAAFINAISDNVGEILNIGLYFLETIMSGISDNLGLVVDTVVNVINSFTNYIEENLDEIITSGLNMMMSLVEGIMEGLPRLIESALDLIGTLVQGLIDNKDEIIEAGKGIVENIISGIAENGPAILLKVAEITHSISMAFMEIDWLGLGVWLIKTIGKGILSFAWNLIKSASGVADDTLQKIRDKFSAGFNIGRDLVNGIRDGLTNAWGGLTDKATELGGRLTESIKGRFRINSPSKIMEDEVGKNITMGIGVGIEGEVPSLLRDLDKSMPQITEKIKGVVNVEQGRSGGPRYNPRSTEKAVVGNDNDYNFQGEVNATFVMDGREMGIATAPFVSEEMEKSGKRRRR